MSDDEDDLLSLYTELQQTLHHCTKQRLAAEADKERLEAKVGELEAALRHLVQACTTGDTYAGEHMGVQMPLKSIVEQSRAALALASLKAREQEAEDG